MKKPQIPTWVILSGMLVLAVGGASAGAAYRADIVQIQADTVAAADEAIAASEDATAAVQKANDAAELADTAATSQLADEQAAAAAEAARVAEEARVAAEAAAAEAARQAAIKVPAKKSADTGGGPTKCPAGTKANAVDAAGNESACEALGAGGEQCQAYDANNVCTNWYKP